MAQGDITKPDDLSEDLAKGVHDFSAHVFDVMLSSTTAPASTTNAVKASFTEVTGGTYAEKAAVTLAAVAEASGATKIKLDTGTHTDGKLTWAQDAGSGPTDIRTAVLYNETSTGDVVVAWWDLTTDAGTTPLSLQAGDVSVTFGTGGDAGEFIQIS